MKNKHRGDSPASSQNDRRGAARRARGAPANNKNALKHGLYADPRKIYKSKGDLLWLIGYYENILTKLVPKVDAALEKDKLNAEDQKNLDRFHAAADRYASHTMKLLYANGEVNQMEKEIEDGIFLTREALGILDYLTPQPETPLDPPLK